MIAMGISRFDCHISLDRLKMHTSDNYLDIYHDGINPFTHSNRREMYSIESFFLPLGASRGRALFTFVYHCDIIARAERRTLRFN